MLGFVFDVDDTLYEQIVPFRDAYNKLFKHKVDIEKLYCLSRYYSEIKYEDSRNGNMTVDEYHIYRVKQAANDLNIILSDEEALNFQKEYKKNQGCLEMTELTKSILDYSLGNNIKLAVITNGPSDHQWSKVKVLGVENWIHKDNIIVSGDLGINKPDKRIFEHAEKKLDLNKNKLFFIGDSLENDVIGANNADWNIIWINRYNQKLPKDVKVYKEVKNNEELFLELKKIVKESL